MLGGSNEAVAVVSPFLKSFCENIFHVGQVGAGAIAKLVNNQIFLTGAIAVQEGLVLAKKAGMSKIHTAENSQLEFREGLRGVGAFVSKSRI